MEKITYQGWPNCYRLANGIVDLVVTGDVGPRIIRFGFEGEDNEFQEFAGMVGLMGGDEWRIYGGHRLWHAPEATPRTYYPDNEAVAVEEHEGYVRVIQPAEPTTGIQKEIDIRLAPDEAHVQLTHRLHNRGMWAVNLAPWALSVMARGGVAILPFPPRGSHTENLQPTSTLTLWAYTDMSDPRWTWGTKYVLLRQDPERESPQKIGAMVAEGWAGYARNGHLMIKTFSHVPGAAYADLGCSVEVFTNDLFLEVETLGPVGSLEPGTTVEHVEDWFLFRDVPLPGDDDDVDQYVLPLVGVARRMI